MYTSPRVSTRAKAGKGEYFCARVICRIGAGLLRELNAAVTLIFA